MPQLAAVTFHCDEDPVVRVRELPFDQRVEVLVTFPDQHRAVVLFGDGPSIVAGLRCVADEVENRLGLAAAPVAPATAVAPVAPATPVAAPDFTIR